MTALEILGRGVLTYFAFLSGTMLMALLSHVLGIDNV
jgi:hypothetical protein